jgi:hypothetical protein
MIVSFGFVLKLQIFSVRLDDIPGTAAAFFDEIL